MSGNFSFTITGDMVMLPAILAALTASGSSGVSLSTSVAAAPIMTGNTGSAPPANADADNNGPADPTAPAADAHGMPWDERIHASTKGRNNDGSWKKKRGADAATIANVEAELRARSAQQQQYQQPAPMFQNGTSAPQPVQQYQPPFQPAPVQQFAPQQQYQQPIQPAPVQQHQYQQPATAAPVQQQPATGMDFNSLMLLISNLFANNTMTPEEMTAMNTALGLQAITQLSADPTRIPAAYDWLRQRGKIQ